MALEIERKFLVSDSSWRAGIIGSAHIRQGYLAASRLCVLRIRTMDDKGYITVKGKTRGLTRPEFEYPVPRADAERMLDTLCDRPPLEKVRHSIRHAGNDWVIDEFEGINEGLVVAEIELEREDQPFDNPAWLGIEVSRDERYSNAYIAANPWPDWRDDPASRGRLQNG